MYLWVSHLSSAFGHLHKKRRVVIGFDSIRSESVGLIQSIESNRLSRWLQIKREEEEEEESRAVEAVEGLT